MKKSLIALAVSGAVVAPAAVQAAEVHGAINVTFESTSSENGGTSLIYNTTADGSGGGLTDGYESRLSISGSEDLGGGLTAGYTFEFGIGTSGTGGGSVNEDSVVNTRLSNIWIAGDWGKVTLGTQWGVLYSYAGWNVYRTPVYGGATHYYMTSPFSAAFNTSDDPSGLRIDHSLTYTYGGGGYSSDPFTFSVELRMDGNDDITVNPAVGPTVTVNDEETIDAIIIGAQTTFAGVTLNATYYQEQNSDSDAVETRDPSMITLGGRWSPGAFYLGGTFYYGDRDTDENANPYALNIVGGMDFGAGFSGLVGVGFGEADIESPDSDSINDMTTFFVHLQKNLSSSTYLYLGLETVTLEDAATDSSGDLVDKEETSILLGMMHSF